MASRDFSHRLSDAHGSLRKPVSLARRLHIDVPLLVLLLVLAAVGLGVLYSASGGDMTYVRRQSIFMCLAFTGMFIVAQIPLDFYRRWSPWAYLGAVPYWWECCSLAPAPRALSGGWRLPAFASSPRR